MSKQDPESFEWFDEHRLKYDAAGFVFTLPPQSVSFCESYTTLQDRHKHLLTGDPEKPFLKHRYVIADLNMFAIDSLSTTYGMFGPNINSNSDAWCNVYGARHLLIMTLWPCAVHSVLTFAAATCWDLLSGVGVADRCACLASNRTCRLAAMSPRGIANYQPDICLGKLDLAVVSLVHELCPDSSPPILCSKNAVTFVTSSLSLLILVLALILY